MSPRIDVATRAADAARSLLDSLDREQRVQATWDFDDAERGRWFYTPTDHGGLGLDEMDGHQQRLTHQLVATGLSTAGYVTMSTIMGLENVLDHVEGWVQVFGRLRGRDPQQYRIAVFGDPGPFGRWGWRFGGHHVSINITVIDGAVVGLTPLFFGADPAASPLLGPHPLRPLAGAEDLGRELVRSLSDEQRLLAVLADVAPTDLITGNRTTVADGDGMLPLPEIWRGRLEDRLHRAMVAAQAAADAKAGVTDEHLDALAFSTAPKGLRIGSMMGAQREIVVALLGVYLERIPPDVADDEQARALAGLDDLHFVWAGGIEVGQPHYYRLQGRELLVEYDNTQRDANHVHTVWRDLTRDFGGDPLAQHYTVDPHH
ncbi:MAG: DUF3500 domain-containing protein [Actinomycetota bacterium]